VITSTERLRRRLRSDAGATDALGLAIMAPAAIGLALVIALLSRDVDTRATAQSAAEAAAQAAVQERSRPAARAAAQRIGDAMLIDVTTCASPVVTLGNEPFTPGGTISVTVSCTTSTDGLESIDPPGRAPQTYTAFAVIDPYRGVAE
jgi:Flp pilus assembly protein TadG